MRRTNRLPRNSSHRRVRAAAAEGFPVENVGVEVGEGRHIESFSWSPEGGDVPEAIGQRCEDEALGQLQVSRT